MKRFLAVCILFAVIASVSAETTVKSFPLALQANESIIKLHGNTHLFAAVLEVKVKGIVTKTEYWIVTNTGRTGPFSAIPTASVELSPNSRSFFAIYKIEGKTYLVYGPNLPGTSMGNVAELYSRREWKPESIVFSPDGSRWATITISKQKQGAYDIVTDKGIFDWFSNPMLVGFLSDNSLLYWTAKKVREEYSKFWGTTFEYYSVVLWRDNAKIYTVPGEMSASYPDNLPATYISPAGTSWGWAEYVKEPKGEETATAKFTVNFPGGTKKIQIGYGHSILYITPDGHVLHRYGSWDRNSFRPRGSPLYLDGTDAGIGEVLGIEAISPDGLRVAIRVDDKSVYVDGEKISVGNAECFYSADSQHFIVDRQSIDGEEVAGPDTTARGYYFGKVNRNTLKYAVVVSDGVYIEKDKYIQLKMRPEAIIARDPCISDDGETVVFIDGGGNLYINGETSYKLYDGMSFSSNRFVLSPNGKEILLNHVGLYMDGHLYTGSFFGKDAVNAPEGSVKYKDGAVVVTTW